MCSALLWPAATLLRLCPNPLRRRRLPVFAFSLTSFSSSCGGSMDGRSPATILVLSGKSPQEDSFALSLKSRSDTAKLIDEEGAETRVLLGSEAAAAASAFDPRAYMDALSASRFGRLLIWSPKIPSTHDLVSKNFAELPLGTVCVTDLQYKGRGRAKNVWESPIGCLLFSFTLQMEDGRKLPLLQYVVSLAVTEAIKTLCQKKGIGLNLDNEKPTTCLNAVLQEINPSSLRLSREEVLASFFNKFETLLETFLTEGFQPLEELYYKTWLHSGQEVVIEEKQEEQPDEKIIVTVQGLTSDGYLLAIDEDNKSYALHPDGNSFDFFKGLVRRKLG